MTLKYTKDIHWLIPFEINYLYLHVIYCRLHADSLDPNPKRHEDIISIISSNNYCIWPISPSPSTTHFGASFFSRSVIMSRKTHLETFVFGTTCRNAIP